MMMAEPRLVKRDCSFYQSKNRLNVGTMGSKRLLLKLLLEDWFHVVLRLRAPTLVFWTVSIWTFSLVVFALLYMQMDYVYKGTQCALDQKSSGMYPFGGYFAFALETCTTVGYTLPNGSNALFENCPSFQILFYFQMVWSMLYNTLVTTFFYARLSRCEARGAQVIFTDKAIIKKKNKKWKFQIRVTDMDVAYPVVEAHVRLYARVGQEMIPLRIESPNDDLGGVMMLSWPNIVSHEIDIHSALYPKHLRLHRHKILGGGLYLREVDGRTGSRDDLVCPVCGETYGDYDRIQQHVKYNALYEKANDYPELGTHQELDMDDFEPPKPPTLQEIQQNFPAEIVCLVEGIDPLVSGTFQAIQSYTLSDIVWKGQFAQCVEIDDNHEVDLLLEKFHTVEEEKYVHEAS